ncbi:MAG TPA: DNA mismatch repair protein MutS [Dehalococcoidia bacterium]|nr:DNA mismatch repair protein MutS [Dehalococcoidia bacterium]
MSTPIRKQYLDLKRRYPDTILFFRLGDFYETFDEDAGVVSKELQIVLTSKPMGKNIRVPLAGVPKHSIDGHITKLVSRGHRVAICEQMADPSTVKGLVPRDVVRVVTAGTVTAEHQLAPDAPNYLASWVERDGHRGAALVDITTGEVRLSGDDEAAVELQRSQPAELLVEDPGVPFSPGCPIVERPQLSRLAVESELARQFGEQAREALVETESEAAALAHVVTYLRDTYPAALGALQRLRTVSGSDSLVVDARTLRNLDILPAVDRSGSLYSLLNGCKSPMGSRLLRQQLVRPSRDRAAIEGRLDAVEWAATRPIERGRCQRAFAAMPDLGRVTGRIGSKSAGPRDLHALRLGLRATVELAAAVEGSGPPPLIERALVTFAGGAEPLLALDGALALDPPATFQDGGVIREGFSPEIDSLRTIASDTRGYLLELERSERKRTGIKSLKVGHNKVFGYYIEVSAANTGLVPPDYQRRQTLVGGERYVTEELKEHESRLVGAQERLAELESQVFDNLVGTLKAGLPVLQAIADGIASIDVALALGQRASERAYCRPEFGGRGAVHLKGARHPVVEASLGPGQFVPNDCLLDNESQILVITGPNMSGKSTFLRQVALIALMAQAGSFVPAESASLPLFDRVFTRIGAQDDLAAGQSTFMVEMVETAQILHQATPDSLVVLDEVGRGTSTFDGMAIARAVVEFLHNRSDLAAKTLFATHYHELTALADVLPRVVNVHVAVREEGGEVVFEHRIVPGPSDRSYGIHVAKLAGLPPAVVERAERMLGELERGKAGSAATLESVVVFQPALPAAGAELESEIAQLDVDSMSPLDAIQALYELRAKAREVRGQ